MQKIGVADILALINQYILMGGRPTTRFILPHDSGAITRLKASLKIFRNRQKEGMGRWLPN